jgi:biopolymer transport protein ExbD
MILPLILAGNLAAAPPAAAAQAGQPAATDIVIVARKRKCRVQLKGALLSDRELDAYAAQWAKGEAVKVHVPSTASYQCLAKIMFRLNDRGVTRAQFIDERTVP